MGNLLFFLVVLLMGFLYPTGWEPLRFYEDPNLVWPLAGLAAVAAGIGIPVAAAGAGLARAVARRGGEPLSRGLERALRLYRPASQALGIAGFGLVTFVFHWPDFIRRTLGLGGTFLLDEAGVLVPFAVLQLLLWAGTHRIDSALRLAAGARAEGPPPRWRAYVGFQSRSLAAFLGLPFLILAGVSDVLDGSESARMWIYAYPFLGWGAVLATLGAVLAGAPFFLRWIWRARPLPPGPLRERLEGLARRLGFRCRDLLVWPTGESRLVNAFVTGLTPGTRYIFFTDALLERLDPDEIEGVLGHEMGHALRHHLTLFAALTAAYALGLLLLESPLARWRDVSPFLPAAAATGMVLAFWGLLFPYLSRRLEVEADLTGAAAAGGVGPFVRALERVAFLNGGPRVLHSWRHFSVERRVALLHELTTDPGERSGFERRMRAVKLGIPLLLGILLILGVVRAAEQWREGPRLRDRIERAFAAEREIRDAFARGDAETAERVASGALAGGLTDEASGYAALGRAHEARGRTETAKFCYRKALAARPAEPAERLDLLRRLGTPAGERAGEPGVRH